METLHATYCKCDGIKDTMMLEDIDKPWNVFDLIYYPLSKSEHNDAESWCKCKENKNEEY